MPKHTQAIFKKPSRVAILADALERRAAFFTERKAPRHAANALACLKHAQKAPAKIPQKYVAVALDAMREYNNITEVKNQRRGGGDFYKDTAGVEDILREVCINIHGKKMPDVMYEIEVAAVYEPTGESRTGKDVPFALIPEKFAGLARKVVVDTFRRYRFNAKETEHQDLESEAAAVYCKLRKRYPSFAEHRFMAAFKLGFERQLIALIREQTGRVWSGESDCHEDWEAMDLTLNSARADAGMDELLSRVSGLLTEPGDAALLKKLTTTKEGIDVISQQTRTTGDGLNKAVRERIDNFVGSPGFAERLREAIMSYSAMYAV